MINVYFCVYYSSIQSDGSEFLKEVTAFSLVLKGLLESGHGVGAILNRKKQWQIKELFKFLPIIHTQSNKATDTKQWKHASLPPQWFH